MREEEEEERRGRKEGGKRGQGSELTSQFNTTTGHSNEQVVFGIAIAVIISCQSQSPSLRQQWVLLQLRLRLKSWY